VARFGAEHVERHPEGARIAHDAFELLHALVRRRDAEAPDLAPAGVNARLLFQPPIQVGAVAHHLRQAGARAQLPDQPGGVERRAARQFVPLDDDHVFPAHKGEMVGNAASSNPAADDDDLCIGLHNSSPIENVSGR
jgi:hypothetical protein